MPAFLAMLSLLTPCSLARGAQDCARCQGDSVPATAQVSTREEGLQVSEDHRERGIWGGSSRAEGGYWARLCHEDTAQDGHVRERTGLCLVLVVGKGLMVRVNG